MLSLPEWRREMKLASCSFSTICWNFNENLEETFRGRRNEQQMAYWLPRNLGLILINYILLDKAVHN